MNRHGYLGTVLVLYAAQAAAQPGDCDRACLLEAADQYVAALLNRDWAGLPWAERVRFTENEVALMMGDGVWGTATAVRGEPFRIADPLTGNVLWLGVLEEHGQAAYYAVRLKVQDRRIAEVETVVGRAGTPGDFAEPKDYAVPPVFARELPAKHRRARAELLALVDRYYDTMQRNDGTLRADFTDDCARSVNGLSTTHGEHRAARAAQGCRAQFEIGLYQPVDEVRARRYPLVDEARGIVVAFVFLDHAARYTEYRTRDGEQRHIPVEYPNSHAVMELFKISDGKIQRIESVSAFSPYLMPTIWTR
jgi:hypothetical protein